VIWNKGENFMSKQIAKQIQSAVNEKMGPENGKSNLVFRINGERFKISVNSGDFYTPMKIAESFPNVEDVVLETDCGPKKRRR
jgi:hypothetical protein